MNIRHQNQIKFHEKCIQLLELIDKEKSRLKYASLYLRSYDLVDWSHPLRLSNSKERLEHDYYIHSKTLQRLINYYANYFVKNIEKIEQKGELINNNITLNV